MTSIKHIKYLCSYIKEHGLSTPEGFEEKSYRWLGKHYNGIGAEWMPQKTRKVVTFLMKHMEPAALIHDVEYLSENKGFWKFTKANLRLFYNGIKSKYFWSGSALAIICQFFGWSAWINGKETVAFCHYLEEEQR